MANKLGGNGPFIPEGEKERREQAFQESKLGPGKALDITQTEGVVCEKCGGKIFSQGIMIRKISGLLTGTGQPGLVPVPVFYCVNCHHVNEEFVPVELREHGSN